MEQKYKKEISDFEKKEKCLRLAVFCLINSVICIEVYR
jgi:hypothetical protein